MTRAETIVIIGLLHTAFPKFPEANPFIPDAKKAMSATVDLWASMFENDPADQVRDAAIQYIATEHFPPTIAAIRSILADKQAADLPTPAALWTEVDRLLNSGIAPDREQEAYAQMSPGCKAATLAAGGWTALSLSAEDDQFIKRQFFRDAADYIAAEKQRLVLGGLAGPVPDVKSLPGDGKQVVLDG